MRTLRFLLAVVSGPLVVSVAMAHPGHGRYGGSNDPRHYLTESEHLFLFAIGLAIIAIAIHFTLRSRDSQSD